MQKSPYQIIQNFKAELRRHQTLVFVCFVFFMGLTFSFFATKNADHSLAGALDTFNPGNIISDSVMANSDSMTLEEIQTFLTQKNSCNNTNYSLYLDQSTRYPKISWHWSSDDKNGHFVCISEEKFGEGTIIGEGETAAEIIYGAAQEYHINPQVLIVLLEKEQGLITDTYPHSNQYRSATGYGCPDTAACDSKYYGFKNQIYRAAELFRYTLDNGSMLYPDNKEGVFVAYHPSAACGGTQVFIENRATSALYRYTPYQPNAAALAAGHGTGNSCSAYGNRNFFLFFTEWFGSPRELPESGADPTILPVGKYGFSSKSKLASGLQVTTAPNDPKKPQGPTTSKLSLSEKTQDIELWNVERDSATGYYTFTDPTTKRRLAVTKDDVDLNTPIDIAEPKNTCADKWRLYTNSDNSLLLETACLKGLFLTFVTDHFELNTFSKQNQNQRWQIYTGDTIPEDMYVISPKSDSSRVMDISQGRNANGANIQLWQANGERPQNWHLEYLPAYDAYTFTNGFSGKLLDLSAANTKPGTNIQLWKDTNACAQRWKMIPDADGYYTAISTCAANRAIDLPNGKAINGANIQLWSTNNADAERWRLTVSQKVADGTYTIVTKSNPEKAMDISGGRNANGANIQLWQANGLWPQEWELKYLIDYDAYEITNPRSNKLLDLSGAKTAYDTNIQLWQYTNACAQRWLIYLDADGAGTLVSACDTNRAADMKGGSTANNTNIRLWGLNRSNAQKWLFEPVETSTD